MTEPYPSGPTTVTPDDRSEDRPQSRASYPPRASGFGNIYLRPPEAKAQPGRLSWLARFLRLEHYPHGLMTTKLHAELTILSLMLVGVFAFEFAVWSFFFNGLFVGDVDRIRPVGTAAAVLFGLLFGGVILYFERQVITADTWRLTRRKQRWAQFIRLLLIAVAGFTVAHTVDLLAFRVPVERRLHARAVDRDELRLRGDLDRLARNANAVRLSTLAAELEGVRERIASVQSSRTQAVGDKERYREQVESLQSEARSRGETVGLAEADLARVEEDVDPAARQRARAELGAARRRSELTASDLRAARSSLFASQATIQEKDRLLETLLAAERKLLDERSELLDESKKLDTIADALESRLDRWVAELRRSPPGDRTERSESLRHASTEETTLWPEEWRHSLEFVEPQAHYFEKIATVYELAFGRQRAADEDSVQPPTHLDRSERFERELANVYRSSFIAIHLAAMFLPFLVFAVKWFLMPKEVDAYFSTWHQAFAGDPGARTVLSIEDKVRRQGERW